LISQFGFAHQIYILISIYLSPKLVRTVVLVATNITNHSKRRRQAWNVVGYGKYLFFNSGKFQL